MYLLYVVSNNKDKKYYFDNLIELLKFIKNGGLCDNDEILYVEESSFHQ